jgi:hypothetical protein
MTPGASPVDDRVARQIRLRRRVLPRVTPSTDAASGNEERTRRWLDWLRDGSDLDKIAARRGLAGVFEQRGMLEEAIELLERNVEEGVRGAETLRWLSRLYQAQGDEARSLEAAVHASQHEPVPLESEPLSLVAVQPPSKRPGVISGPMAYLLVILGLGIAIGVAVWMLTRF